MEVQVILNVMSLCFEKISFKPFGFVIPTQYGQAPSSKFLLYQIDGLKIAALLPLNIQMSTICLQDDSSPGGVNKFVYIDHFSVQFVIAYVLYNISYIKILTCVVIFA